MFTFSENVSACVWAKGFKGEECSGERVGRIISGWGKACGVKPEEIKYWYLSRWACVETTGWVWNYYKTGAWPEDEKLYEPESDLEGEECDIHWGYWCGQKVTGYWDPDDKGCIFVSEEGKGGATKTVNWCSDYNVQLGIDTNCNWNNGESDDAEGNNKCEQVCGADAVCDEKSPGVAWLYQDRAGTTYCGYCSFDCKFNSQECPTHKPSSHDVARSETCHYSRYCVYTDRIHGCYYAGIDRLRKNHCDVCTSDGVEEGDYCPPAGTVSDSTCYYGIQSCDGTTCNLGSCTLKEGEFCHPSQGCIVCKAEGEECSDATECCSYYASDSMCYYSPECSEGKCNYQQEECSSDEFCSPTGCIECKKQDEECSDITQCCSYYVSDSTCYFSPTCSEEGKCDYGENVCDVADVCEENTLTINKKCSSQGCSDGETYRCNADIHENCQEKTCGNIPYNCTYDGLTWAWRTSNPEEVCDDGVDNDCDGYVDSADLDCTTYNFYVELYGDYEQTWEYSSVEVDGSYIGDACKDYECKKCDWNVGLVSDIDISKYCSDDEQLEVTFEDTDSVNQECEANHRACVYYDDDWHCCEAQCDNYGCTNSVTFDCDDWSCITRPTTTTTIPLEEVSLGCKRDLLYVGESNDCFVENCNDGLWMILNKEGNPLGVPIIIERIPSDKIKLATVGKGKILILAICFDPPAIKRHVITVTRMCPETCKVNQECSCVVEDCNLGVFTLIDELGTAVATEDITQSPFIYSFLPEVEGDLNAIMTCADPEMQRTETISITGICSGQNSDPCDYTGPNARGECIANDCCYWDTATSRCYPIDCSEFDTESACEACGCTWS